MGIDGATKQAYKQIGNSVCVPVVKRLAEQILKVMEGYYDIEQY